MERGDPVESDRDNSAEAQARRGPDVGDLADGRYRLVANLYADVANSPVFLSTHVPVIVKYSITGQEARFKEEIVIHRSLHRDRNGDADIQPNIVRMLDSGYDKLRPFIVLEYAGPTLQNVLDLNKGNPLNHLMQMADVWLIFSSLAIALKRLASKKVAHRDIKPANICLLAENKDPILVRLIDFGTANTPSTRSQTGEQEFGTPGYRCPETLPSHHERWIHHLGIDQWSLAVVLHELLCGYVPFANDPPLPYYGYKKVADNLPNNNRGINFKEFFMKAFHENRHGRYHTIEEMLDAAKQCFDNYDAQVTRLEPNPADPLRVTVQDLQESSPFKRELNKAPSKSTTFRHSTTNEPALVPQNAEQPRPAEMQPPIPRAPLTVEAVTGGDAQAGNVASLANESPRPMPSEPRVMTKVSGGRGFAIVVVAILVLVAMSGGIVIGQQFPKESQAVNPLVPGSSSEAPIAGPPTSAIPSASMSVSELADAGPPPSDAGLLDGGTKATAPASVRDGGVAATPKEEWSDCFNGTQIEETSRRRRACKP